MDPNLFDPNLIDPNIAFVALNVPQFTILVFSLKTIIILLGLIAGALTWTICLKARSQKELF